MTSAARHTRRGTVEAVHILLVQSDETPRRGYRVNFELDGFRVSEAGDGAEALRRARDDLPDLVVLDLLLPVLDGWETLGELKTDETLRSIPVVILTASSEERDELRARERGALAFVARPVRIEDLIRAVRRALVQSPGGGNGRPPTPVAEF